LPTTFDLTDLQAGNRLPENYPISRYLSGMRHHLLALAALSALLGCPPRPAAPAAVAVATQAATAQDAEAPTIVSRIAFGSCAEQDKPQPILEAAIRDSPDLFIYLGDNIYGDTDDMSKLRREYAELGKRPEFQHLIKATHVIATWDDHDFGVNDGGRHYPKKEESKEIFLDFWREPADAPRRMHAGIYDSRYYGDAAHRVQVILLDTRTFRDDLLENNDEKRWKNDYRPNENPDSTFLGVAQWAWLAEELRKPAVFRFIASSNQFAHDYNGYESWTNVPMEQKRMVDLIAQTQAEGVIFMSGDVHWGELSLMQTPNTYPIYDMTSSGITETWHKVEPNKFRVGNAEPANNYGLFTIAWLPDPVLTMALKTVDGKATVTQVVKRSQLGW
jgi:alkaline phosphatase D